MISSVPKFLGKLSPVNFNDRHIPNCKNALLENVFEEYDDDIIHALKTMASSLKPSFKRYLVDIKSHDLKVGDIPCLPGWHLDGGPASLGQYVLCVSGISNTTFLNESVKIPSGDNMKVVCNRLDKRIRSRELSNFQIGNWEMFLYDNLAPHRGSVSVDNGRRLLLRVMGTNTINPIKIKSI